MAKKIPLKEDQKVGENIRSRRLACGMSQEKLGDALGVTFQQIQKYEKGTNRVGSSRLVAIAKVLGSSVQDLFDGIDIEGDQIKVADVLDPRVGQGATILQKIPADKLDHALAVLRTFVKA
ncbi:helix-turn-helix domain-containing protein [Hoeflea sp. G2-23]|uniref:Helix-turn-helix domain-containing protein n=1 Tax=Hoeflea algicola TaxID=2983763 RepID=A0ABT3Z5H4_9HYPH|nr:helix-turn-helix transcriptional regulator [Hoeflea algicola]MCY0147030.1 helix-turn-helix domain-containing protein [Hoeflea algicola]